MEAFKETNKGKSRTPGHKQRGPHPAQRRGQQRNQRGWVKEQCHSLKVWPSLEGCIDLRSPPASLQWLRNQQEEETEARGKKPRDVLGTEGGGGEQKLDLKRQTEDFFFFF